MNVSDCLWRVSPALPSLKLTGAALFVLAGVLLRDGDPVRLPLALVAAAALAAWGLRDVLAPVRLAADPTGLTVVVGFASRRHIPWSRVERIRLENRARHGLRTELLEIDTGDSLHLFSAHDLGAPPSEVAETVAALRTGAT